MKSSTAITVLFSAATLVSITACSVPKMPADIQSGIAANDPAAFYKAGKFYDNLKHVSDSKKWAKSAEMYLKGAQLGNADCQSEIGYAYKQGAGVPRDYNQALAWYTKAAKQNHTGGLVGLGYMYDEAIGVKEDDAKALKLYDRAAALGSSSGKKNAAILRKEMARQSPASITGKTFSFAAPYSLRYNSRLGTFRDDAYTTDSVAWHWGNKKRIEKDNGEEYSIQTFEYKKTGSQTATLDTSLAEGMHVALHKDFVARHYELKFETPTSGTCTLEVTGRMGSIGADKYTATGKFTLK